MKISPTALIEFFTHQKTLKTVKILPYEYMDKMQRMWPDSLHYNHGLHPVLFQILDSCCELRELSFFPSRDVNCMLNLKTEQWWKWGPKLSMVEKISVSAFVVDDASSTIRSLSSSESHGPVELRRVFGCSLVFLMLHFTHLEHLIMADYASSYCVLQTIFKCLVSFLKLICIVG